MEEYYTEERCYSAMVVTPGSSLFPAPIMGVWYILFLGYLFLGIAISADIFMMAIEVITSQTIITTIDVIDHETGEVKSFPQEMQT